MAKVSPHFSYREVIKSHTALRLGIDNTPSQEVLSNAVDLARNVLEPIRDQFGPFSPSSWFRCEELERVICHKAFRRWQTHNSYPGYELNVDAGWDTYFARKQHPKGRAADIEIATVSNDDLFAWIRDHLTYDQLIREFAKPGDPHSGWVHVSYRPGSNRGEAFRI